MNARIRKVNAHIESEVLAPVVTIVWSPTEGPHAATITFQCQRFHRYVDGTYFGAPEPDGAITVSAAQLFGRAIPVMLPGGQIVGEQPAELFDGMLRGMFDLLYHDIRYPALPEPPEDSGANGPTGP